MLKNGLIHEAEEMMRICNSCRYCEGYCAVWPAMEYRRVFEPGDLTYLANLCHDCSDCYYACQYAPPHEFAVNPPLTFSRLRKLSYEHSAWPKALNSAFRANGLIVSLVLFLGIITFMLGAILIKGSEALMVAVPAGNFYQIISHNFMVVAFGITGLFSALALGIGLIRYWRNIGEKLLDLFNPIALAVAIKEILQLKYLDGNGWGCRYPGEDGSQSRRWFHHFTFYGFMLCFAATTLGAIYHYVFGWHAPHSYISLPVVLGTLGGLGLLIGPAGLFILKGRRNRDITDGSQTGMDTVFLVLLFLTSATGLLLLVLRETPAMGILTVIHLGIVMALFLTLPYGKFVHSIFRAAAIVKYALERKRKRTIGA
jgi:citrate/tricarballylate utilization protein